MYKQKRIVQQIYRLSQDEAYRQALTERTNQVIREGKKDEEPREHDQLVIVQADGTQVVCST